MAWASRNVGPGDAIRMHASDVSMQGRATQGVRLINLDKGDTLETRGRIPGIADYSLHQTMFSSDGFEAVYFPLNNTVEISDLEWLLWEK